MATVQVFNSFKAAVANGVHDLSSNTLKLALTNTAPSLANTQLADITQIAATGSYAPVTIAVTSSAQTGGTYTLALDAATFTPSGAAFDDFRYIVLFDDTATNDELIAYLDYGASISLGDGEPFTIGAATWLTSD